MMHTLLIRLMAGIFLSVSFFSISFADFYVIPVAKKGYVDTRSGDAAANDILVDKKAWVDGVEVTGNIEIMSGDNASTNSVYSSGNPVRLVAPAGYYDGDATVTATEAQIITLEPEINTGNIKSGVTIMGVDGSVIPASGHAGDTDVLSGQSYSNQSGGSTGTMPDNEGDNPATAQSYADSKIKLTAPVGFYDGNDSVTATEAQIRTLDADIISTNIASGVTIFGQAGDSNIVDTSTGDAQSGDIIMDKKAWVNGQLVTGSLLPTVSIADLTMLEGSNNVGLAVDFTFTIMLGRLSDTNVSVTYTSSDGTAEAGSDYTTTSDTLTITAGHRFGTISIPVTADLTDEADETFLVTLSAPSGAVLGKSVAAASIVNDDMRYFKIDGNGVTIPFVNQSDDYNTTPWNCVTDESTGLMWEVKTPADDGGLRDAGHKYTWYNSDAATNGGNAGIANGGTCVDTVNCDTEKYVAAVNAAALCGYNDWRMPLLNELQSIVEGTSGPTINTAYFPHTVPSHYWSASPGAYSSDDAWYVHFYFGYSNDSYKGGSRYVRLVRAGQ